MLNYFTFLIPIIKVQFNHGRPEDAQIIDFKIIKISTKNDAKAKLVE
jgi:hypothetical protein